VGATEGDDSGTPGTGTGDGTGGAPSEDVSTVADSENALDEARDGGSTLTIACAARTGAFAPDDREDDKADDKDEDDEDAQDKDADERQGDEAEVTFGDTFASFSKKRGDAEAMARSLRSKSSISLLKEAKATR